MEREERYAVLPSDVKMVEDHISRLTRATVRSPLETAQKRSGS
jgi:hypothetical protein